MEPQIFNEGIDPTGLTCISKADILQLIRAAGFNYVEGYGGIVVKQTAPDVVTYPQFKTFIWLESDVSLVPTGDLYYYNGTSWTLLSLVDGSLLAAGSVPLSKLSMTGSTALYIMRANAANNAIEWVSILTAITNNSLTLAKLLNPGAGNFILGSAGAVNQWFTPAGLMALLTPIAMTNIESGDVADNVVFASLLGTNQYITAQALLSLVVSPMTALQSLRRNAANNAWEAYTPASGTLSNIFSAHKNGTAQNGLANGVWTKVTFGTEDYDDDNVYNAAVSTWTCPTTGKYRFGASVSATSAGGGDLNLGFYVNGVLAKRVLFNILAGQNTQPIIEKIFSLAAGTTVEVYLFNNTGANVDLDGQASVNWLEGYRIF